jgi:hypothetical protein
MFASACINFGPGQYAAIGSDKLLWLKNIYNNLLDYFCAVLEMYFVFQEEGETFC